MHIITVRHNYIIIKQKPSLSIDLFTMTSVVSHTFISLEQTLMQLLFVCTKNLEKCDIG